MPGAKLLWGKDLQQTVVWIGIIDLLVAFPYALIKVHEIFLHLYELMSTNVYSDTSKSKDAAYSRTRLKLESFAVLMILLIHIVWMGFEVYLSKIIRDGALKKNFTNCFKWFNFRVALLMFGTYLTLLDIATQNYNLSDVVYEIKSVYRVCTMVLVKCFMNQIEEIAKKAWTSTIGVALQDMALV